MRKLIFIGILLGLVGCGVVCQDGESNKITNIQLVDDEYHYTIKGGYSDVSKDVKWVSETDLGFNVGDLITITKFEEVN